MYFATLIPEADEHEYLGTHLVMQEAEELLDLFA
jgi:hypothetical protein